MIHRLRLTNWKAYDSLDVEFGPGTTFVVASNGVGKTSLISAVAWGLYGDRAKTIKAAECIRAGTDGAEVEVTVGLADDSVLTITRTIARRGRPGVEFRLDGDPVAAATAEGRLEDSFGVDLSTAARLSIMVGGGHIDANRGLELESHLHQAFGVADLLRAADFAKHLKREAENAREGLRETSRQRLSDRHTIEQELHRLELDLQQREITTTTLQAAVAAADQVRAQAAQWADYEAQLATMHDQLDRLSQEVADLTGHRSPVEPIDRQDLAESVAAARSSAQQRRAETTQQLTAVKAEIIAATTALDLLEGERHLCPTCLRPIDTDGLETARNTHSALVDRASSDTEGLEQQITTANEHQEAAEHLLVRIRALTEPRRPNVDHLTDLDAAETVYQDALAAIDEHNQNLGTVRAQLQGLRQQLDADDAIQQDQDRLIAAYRREGLAVATADALRVAADELTAARIEPIATEVQWRWKQLFSDGGLQLAPDGSITRLVANETLPWETLSGGERIWARLVTHLLIIETSTTLPTAWFDEPLEHLDPKLRRTVASYLATATNTTGPNQLIVATYEHEMASQLAADNDTASIVYLR